MGSGASNGEFSIILVLKVTLQSVRLLLTVSYRKIGEEDVLLAPPIILLGKHSEAAAPCFGACGHVVSFACWATRHSHVAVKCH